MQVKSGSRKIRMPQGPFINPIAAKGLIEENQRFLAVIKHLVLQTKDKQILFNHEKVMAENKKYKLLVRIQPETTNVEMKVEEIKEEEKKKILTPQKSIIIPNTIVGKKLENEK